MNESRGFEFLDIITLLSFWMQVINYEELKSQATTDDIYRELRKQDVEYLERIIQNQETIMSQLANLLAD